MDKLTDDDVFLQALQPIPSPLDRRVGEHAGNLLKGCRCEKRISNQGKLGDTQKQGPGSGGTHDSDDFNKMTFEEMYDFMLIWYVAGGNKQVNNIEIAVEKYGLGKGIDRFEDARAGDFMDISRTNGTGHTVVFQDWSRNDSGQIIGVRYWSSQESGVGFNTEYFDTSGQGIVCSNQVYIARVLPVRQFKSFR